MSRRTTLLLASLVLLGVARPAASTGPFEAFGLVRLDGGARAPAFTLTDLDGEPVTVSPETGPTLLVFWGTW